MSPAAARRMYRRQVVAAGETIVLRRPVPNGPAVEASVRARLSGFSPEEVAGGISGVDRKAVVLAEDVEAAGFPVPIRAAATDRVLVDGLSMTIMAVDETTRRVGGVLIAYELTLAGPA